MAVNYVLEESMDGAAWSAIQNDGSTQADRTGLGFATYAYRVQACNAAGCSGYSNTASVVSNPPPVTPAITFSVQYVWLVRGARKIRCEASWTPIAGAASYEFQAIVRSGDEGSEGPVVGGVRVGNSPSQTRTALERAGYGGQKNSNKSGIETGTLHTISSMKMDVRVMDGGPRHPPRVSVTRQSNPGQGVNPENGKNFGNLSRGEQRTGSHI